MLRKVCKRFCLSVPHQDVVLNRNKQINKQINKQTNKQTKETTENSSKHANIKVSKKSKRKQTTTKRSTAKLVDYHGLQLLQNLFLFNSNAR